MVVNTATYERGLSGEKTKFLGSDTFSKHLVDATIPINECGITFPQMANLLGKACKDVGIELNSFPSPVKK